MARTRQTEPEVTPPTPDPDDPDEIFRDDEPAAKPSVDERLVQVLERLTEASQAGPIKQIPITQVKNVTPWNPTGTRDRPRLARPTFMNRGRLREILMTDEEITLFNQLRAGVYHGGRWVVVETAGGKGQGSVELLIPNATPEDRLELKGECPTLAAILHKLIAEQDTRQPAHA